MPPAHLVSQQCLVPPERSGDGHGSAIVTEARRNLSTRSPCRLDAYSRAGGDFDELQFCRAGGDLKRRGCCRQHGLSRALAQESLQGRMNDAAVAAARRSRARVSVLRTGACRMQGAGKVHAASGSAERGTATGHLGREAGGPEDEVPVCPPPLLQPLRHLHAGTRTPLCAGLSRNFHSKRNATQQQQVGKENEIVSKLLFPVLERYIACRDMMEHWQISGNTHVYASHAGTWLDAEGELAALTTNGSLCMFAPICQCHMRWVVQSIRLVRRKCFTGHALHFKTGSLQGGS